MAKSSINFQKTKSNSTEETTRAFIADYILPKEHWQGNDYWNLKGYTNFKKIKNLDNEVFTEELKKTKRKGGPVPHLENSCWEAALNLNENHTLDDVQKLVDKIEKKLNITATRIAIHRDEGKVLDDGSVKYNYHGHLNFVTYKDGRQNYRRQYVNKKTLSELQTLTAKILNMERGEKGSKAIRANHRELRENYNEIMEQRKAPKMVKELKIQIETQLKDLKIAENGRKQLEQEMDILRIGSKEDLMIATQSLNTEQSNLKANYNHLVTQLQPYMTGKYKDKTPNEILRLIIDLIKQQKNDLAEAVKELRNYKETDGQKNYKSYNELERENKLLESKVANLEEYIEEQKPNSEKLLREIVQIIKNKTKENNMEWEDLKESLFNEDGSYKLDGIEYFANAYSFAPNEWEKYQKVSEQEEKIKIRSYDQRQAKQSSQYENDDLNFNFSP